MSASKRDEETPVRPQPTRNNCDGQDRFPGLAKIRPAREHDLTRAHARRVGVGRLAQSFEFRVL
jgi:hypothetical protein